MNMTIRMMARIPTGMPTHQVLLICCYVAKKFFNQETSCFFLGFGNTRHLCRGSVSDCISSRSLLSVVTSETMFREE